LRLVELARYVYVFVLKAVKYVSKCISYVAMFEGNGMEIGGSKW
jgi:hypothetical protein